MDIGLNLTKMGCNVLQAGKKRRKRSDRSFRGNIRRVHAADTYDFAIPEKEIITLTLWISLGFLVIASFLPKSFNSRFIFGGSGCLAIYWSGQLGGYIELKDYVNIILVIAAAFASLFIAHSPFFGFHEPAFWISHANLLKIVLFQFLMCSF